MKSIQICVILSMTLLAISDGRHNVRKREAREARDSLSSRERRDYFKPHPHSGKLSRFSDTEMKVVNPPKLAGGNPSEAKRRSSTNNPQQRSLHGYLQLMPIMESRSVKRMWPQERIMSGYKTIPDMTKSKQKPAEELNIGEKLARWFFSSYDDDSEEAGTAPRGTAVRPPSSYMPPNYESYPPFHQDDHSKGYPPSKHQRPKGPPAHRPHPKPYKQARPDCNPCNSVPWIPISKTSAGSSHNMLSLLSQPIATYGVPTIDVHHDTTGYSSSHQAAVLPPAPVVEHAPDTTISGSFGLPAGNIPTGHGLLAPVNHLAALPSSYGSPEIQHHYAQSFGNPIPFPELSPVPVVPLHNSNQFVKPETTDLVPPIPPAKSVSNVIFTISEQHGPNIQHIGNNYLEKGESQSASQHSGTLAEADQSSQPSSLIDTRATGKFQDINRFHSQHNHRYQTQSNLDIVKSVPLAEYTSSIEYPLHVIQSGPYIDITTSQNSTTEAVTYEKEPQTGSQKVSDIILGSVKDNDSKKAGSSQTDSDTSGSIKLEQSANDIAKETTKNYFTTIDGASTTTGIVEATTATTIQNHSPVYVNHQQDKGSSPYYIEVQPSVATVVQPFLHSFQNSFHQEQGQLILNPLGLTSNTPNSNVYSKDYLDPNILTPPPLPPSMTQLLPLHDVSHFDPPSGTPTPYLNPPRPGGIPLRPTKETPQPAGVFNNPPSTTWLLPAQSDVAPQWLLPASSSPTIPFPFNLEQHGIASVINGGLLPPPPPQPLNANAPKTKKIQIIIPYTTINSKDYDQNALDSIQKGIYQQLLHDNMTLPETERAHTWLPIVVTEQPPQENQGRKVPKRYQTFENFKSVSWNEGQHSENKPVSTNVTDSKQVQHILAGNIKQLLKGEVEKPKSEQNLRLQKNIDNWTALEYSNHKIVSKKEPQDVISHAQAVTSIPGTSISHLLLPSKKIPATYLTTTPIPLYDEPKTTSFASSVSVDSKPFTTKFYTTASMYSTVARNGLFTTTPKPTTSDSEKRNVFKININKLEQIKQQNIRNSQLSSFANQENHRNGYLSKTTTGHWGKFNENLVVPEPVGGKKHSEKPEATTIGTTWFDHKISISPVTNEKVYVVTPVPNWDSSDLTTTSRDVYKRTTRHIATTEKYVPTTSVKDLDKKASTYPKPTIPPRNPAKIPRPSFTKLEKIENSSKATVDNTKDYVRIKAFNKNDSTPLFRLKNETLYRPKISKFNKPKPIDKFFATTTAPLKSASTVATNVTKQEVKNINSTKDDKPSINDLFPFRNGGELPLEMTKTNLDAAQIEFKNTGARKTLIRQVKINKKIKNGPKASKVKETSEETTTTDYQEWTTTEDLPETSTVIDGNLQVDVLLPHNSTNSTKETLKKKATGVEEKKKFLLKKPSKQPEAATKSKNIAESFNPDEPNITDDEREKINELPVDKNKGQSAEETLIAVETQLPKGVFGETSKVDTKTGNSSGSEWPFKSDSIQETIRLLKEFLKDSSDDEKSDDKTSLKVNKDFKEHDKLLNGLESLKPMLNRTAEGNQSDAKSNVKDNLKSIESKLLKKINKHGKDMYVFNFPEYLVDDLSLNKHEIGLVEGAMIELRKSKQKKALEA